MQANHIVAKNEVERKLLAAIVAFFSLKYAAILICSVALLVVILYVLSVLLSALFEVCQQIALTWAGCSPVEKILMLALGAVIIAWAVNIYGRWHHAGI